MTFRGQSERMFVGVLVAAVLHGALLMVMHKLFDLDFEDYTRPLAVRLLAPDARDVPVREDRRSLPAVPKQEQSAPAVAPPEPAQQPVATARPAPEPEAQPAPERVAAQEPAPVRTQPRTESATARPATAGSTTAESTIAESATEEASPRPAAAWTPALRQPVESAPVRGRGGLNALSGDVATRAEPRSGAAIAVPAPFSGQGDIPTTFKDGLALPEDESVYARSASSPTPGDRAGQGAGAEDTVPVVRDPGLIGRNREAAAPLAPVRMSGTPTARRADAPGAGTGGTEPASVPLDGPTPRAAKPAPVDATVSGGAAAAPSKDTAGIDSSDLDRLDGALSAGGRDSTASAGEARGSSAAAGGVAGPLFPDVRLPDGWNVSGSLGLRPLLNVVDPALPDRYPDEIVRSTVRVWIRVDPQGWVKVDRFERDSGSTELNKEITETLRQWRYEPVEGQDPVYGMVTIEIRTRSTEVAVGGS